MNGYWLEGQGAQRDRVNQEWREIECRPLLISRRRTHNSKNVSGGFESVLINAHVGGDIITTIARKSLAMCIARDILHSYMNLLNHLAGVNNTREWEACATQLKNYADELSLIRRKYCHHIQMICSLKLQQAEISNLRSKMIQPGVEVAQGYSNLHCESALHGGGRTSCPWVNKTSVKAK